jgi:hypothetical protein
MTRRQPEDMSTRAVCILAPIIRRHAMIDAT